MAGKTIVMKFGGSSIASPEKMLIVAEHIKNVRAEGSKIVVVLSAMGDTTDELIQKAEKCHGKPLPTALRGELDKLLVTGEEQSAPLLAITLNGLGVPAVSLTSREINLEANEQGRVKEIKGIVLIKNYLRQNRVVIVTGFQGVVNIDQVKKSITTLGRGGSDVTAVCLAATLGLKYCENYTDVDGVFATDPRIVPGAKRLERISYQQLIQLASVGGGKLMDRAVLLAQGLGVQIRVLLSPSFGESTGGTMVCSGNTLRNIETEISQPGLAIQKLKLVQILNVPNIPGIAGKIFSELQDFNLRSSIQAPATDDEASISILFFDKDACSINNALNSMKSKLSSDVMISRVKSVAVLTLVDPLMNECSGYLYVICEALGDAGINIIAQSSPGITIEVIVDIDDLRIAAEAIAKRFKLVEEN